MFKLVFLGLALCLVASAQSVFNNGGGGGTGSAAIACVGAPGNTIGAYRQQCQTSAGAVYACNNAAGCTVAADWVAGGGGQGPAGTGYAATSTSSVAIGIASGVTYTTQSGLAYLPGNTVQATNASNSADYNFGTVTSYSGTALVLNVTAIGGSGTFASWNIGLQGSPGLVGPVGSSAVATFLAGATTGTLTHNFGTATHAVGPCIDTTGTEVIGWTVALPLGVNADVFTFPTALINNTSCYATSGGSGTGSNNTGTVDQLAYYAASGNTLSGLATANNSVLSTNGSGVPALSTTLPTGLTIPGYQAAISGLTTSVIPKAASASTITNSSVTDNGTTVSTPEPFAAGSTGGVGGSILLPEGTAASSASADDICYGDSTLHGIKCSYNAGSFLPMALGPASDTSGHLVTWSGTGGNLLADAATSASVIALFSTCSGTQYLGADGACHTASASSSLSAITPATATNTIANGNFGGQVWNFAQTTNSQTAFTVGETTAATGSSDLEMAIITLAGSTAIPLTITDSLTGSQILPALFISPTWNTSGVVDAAIKVNVVNTASGAGSLLADLQIGGTSEWKVDKAGNQTSLGTVTAGSTGGAGGLIAAPEGTAPSAVSGTDNLYGDSTKHEFLVQANGGAAGLLARVRPSPLHSTGLLASVSTATLCTNTAGTCDQAGQYFVDFNFVQGGTACSVPGAGGVSLQLTWTDAAGTHSAVSVPVDDSGGGTPALGTKFTFQTSNTAAWAMGHFVLWSTGSAVIQYATTFTACTTGTGNYELDASVTRLQ